MNIYQRGNNFTVVDPKGKVLCRYGTGGTRITVMDPGDIIIKVVLP